MLILWSFIAVLACIPALMFKRKQSHHGATKLPPSKRMKEDEEETNPILREESNTPEGKSKKYGSI